MQNLIRFIRMYHFLLLFLIFQSISLTLIINNNSYQNYRIIKKTSEYTGFIYSISQNIKDYFQEGKLKDDIDRAYTPRELRNM